MAQEQSSDIRDSPVSRHQELVLFRTIEEGPNGNLETTRAFLPGPGRRLREQMLWCTTLVPAFRKLRQRTESSRPASTTQ